jgi:hypothetical protein
MRVGLLRSVRNGWHSRPSKRVKKAAEYEETAKTEPDRTAIGLRERAKLCLEWIAALKTGKWMS